MWIVFTVLGIGILLLIIAGIIAGTKEEGKEHKKNHNYYRSQINATYTGNDQENIARVGQQGENIVSRNLIGILDTYGGYLLNDFCFKDHDGYSSEIDHILIVRCGVFVIETKTNTGTISGKREDKKWVAVKNYQGNKTLANPIKQNEGHINHLKKVLGRNAPTLESMIIFPAADISCIQEASVFSMSSALNYLEKRMNGVTYNDEKMKRINDMFLNVKQKFGITKEQHIQNIKRIHKD